MWSLLKIIMEINLSMNPKHTKRTLTDNRYLQCMPLDLMSWHHEFYLFLKVHGYSEPFFFFFRSTTLQIAVYTLTVTKRLLLFYVVWVQSIQNDICNFCCGQN